jgi:hypothetical protein
MYFNVSTYVGVYLHNIWLFFKFNTTHVVLNIHMAVDTTDKTEVKTSGVDVMITIFCDFYQFSAKKMLWSKFLHNLDLLWVKNDNFCNLFRRKFLKIITSVPGLFTWKVVFVSRVVAGCRAIPNYVEPILSVRSVRHGTTRFCCSCRQAFNRTWRWPLWTFVLTRSNITIVVRHP